MNYPDSLNYLNSLSPKGIRLGLENTGKLLRHFGDPHLKVRSIHIAGTNGKGSTAAFVESILRASGYRVGLYTSPHLIDFRERIQINRAWISEETFCHWAEQIRQATDNLKLSITYFEFATVMAFLHFQEQKVDYSVLETGMGGRLDATNLCQAEVSIITNISLDHSQYLGEDLAAIAKEKAAIIKSPSPVICGEKNNIILQIFKENSLRNNSKLFCLEEEFFCQNILNIPEGQQFNFQNSDARPGNFKIPLSGPWQAENASLAIACCLELQKADEKISEDSIRTGLRTVSWEGRLEITRRSPTLILDCAHNLESVKQMTSYLKANFKFNKCRTLFGVMKDKPYLQMIDFILDISDHLILTQPKSERSLDAESILKELPKSDKPIDFIREIPYALYTALKISEPEDLVLVTGSFYTVSEAKQSIDKKGNSTFNPPHGSLAGPAR